MKRTLLFLPLFLSLTFTVAAQDDMTALIERGLERARSQATLLAKSLEDKAEQLPRTFEGGKLHTCHYSNWVSGFFPGLLWMLHEDSGSPELRRLAELFTARVEPAKEMTSTHDLGFMLYCSFGHGLRITGNPHYRDVILHGTRSLLTRWNEQLGVMRSWDFNDKWQYPVIIDNMMNLEMLCHVARTTGHVEPRRIACRHADVTIKNHFRPDYSTFHVVSYDTLSFQPHAHHTAQGYSHGSAWARGQAWGLYGYTMMYRETGFPHYLEQARHIAHFLAHHPRLPHDKVPYWDYDAPDIPNAQRDASAAAIMASALIELSVLDTSAQGLEWLQLAKEQLRTLSTPTYLAEEGEQGGFLLRHGVGSLPAKSEVDVPLTYADYYYVEALLRLKALQK